MSRISAAIFLLWAATATTHALDPSYEALRSARPDGRRIEVSELVLQREAFTLHFSGEFHLLEPAGEITFGAVFLGQGRLDLTPSDPRERQHLALLTNTADLETLTDGFDRMVMLFADGTATDLLRAGTPTTGPPESRAVSVYEEFLARQRRDLRTNLHLRLVRHMANEGDAAGPFFAYGRGGTLPATLIAIDPAGMLDSESVCLLADHEQKGGAWYSAAGAAGPARPERRRLVDPQHYDVDTVVERDTDLRGTTTVTFSVNAPRLQVLPFDLVSSLRIEEALRIDGEKPERLAVIQEPEKDDAEPALIFPAPLPAGEQVTLRIRYAGDGVLQRDGEGLFTIGARTSWYANLGGFEDLATFDLTYRVPRGFRVVSVGEARDESAQDGQTVQRFSTSHPVRVAGFNYGKFQQFDHTEENTGTAVQVYTSLGTPDVITEINQSLSASQSFGSVQDAVDTASTNTVGYNGPNRIGPSHIALSTESLAQAAMADASNSVQIYTALFGPLPTKHLSITQQSQWNFGQAWPTLVFLPYLAALDPVARANLGIGGAGAFIDEVTLHEVAHQWWGHLVGWDTYRDQWLSEGFAEFSAAMALEMTRGPQAYDAFWERQTKAILSRPRGSAISNDQAGPISMGYRLNTARSPYAYSLVYAKGGYVLQMLRALMRDTESKSDERFFAMMRDFVTRYSGRNPSTDDFKQVIEAHMTPELNGARNGKMDWFFDQWIHGTAIPRLRVDAEIEKAGRNKFRFHGSVTQEGVPDDFLTLVPMYLDFGKEDYRLFGRAPLIGNAVQTFDVTAEMSKKPKRVVANAHHEILARE